MTAKAATKKKNTKEGAPATCLLLLGRFRVSILLHDRISEAIACAIAAGWPTAARIVESQASRDSAAAPVTRSPLCLQRLGNPYKPQHGNHKACHPSSDPRL